MSRNFLLSTGAVSLLFALAPFTAFAQGFGEQRPLQFRNANNGLTLEVYRRQLGASAAASAAASATASGVGASGQSGSAVNNAVQTTRYLNVSVTGENNILNVVGETINASQESSNTEQSSSNQQVSTRLNK